MDAPIAPTFALLLAVWSLVTYSFGALSGSRASRLRDPDFWARPAVLLGAVLLLTGGHVPVAALFMAAALVADSGRRGIPARFAAEWEIFVVLAIVILDHWTHSWITLPTWVTSLPVSTEWTSAIGLFAAAIAFLGEGGSVVVRGVLEKTAALPTHGHPILYSATISRAGSDRSWDVNVMEGPIPSTAEADSDRATEAGGDDDGAAQLGKGRLIGYLERWTVAFLAFSGSLAAVAFVVAAKGVVRASELKDREFAEYFLIGTLTSILLALLCGALLRLAISL